jgi:oligosaccharide repeat unit polymerase
MVIYTPEFFIALTISIITFASVFVNINKLIDLLNPLVIFYLNYVIFINIGAFIMVINPDTITNYIHTGEYMHQSLNKHLLIVTISISIVVVSYYITSYFIKLRSKNISSWVDLEDNLIFKDLYKHRFLIYFGFFTCLILSVIRFYMEENILSLINNLITADLDGRNYRKELTVNDGIGEKYIGQGYFNFITYKILPFFSLLTALHLYNKKKYFLFLFSIIVVSIMLNGELRRGPFIHYITIFIFVYFSYTKRIKFVHLIFYSIIFVFLIAVLSMVQGKQNLLSSIVYRLFISQSQTGFYIVQLYPEIIDYAFGGIYFQNISNLLPGFDVSHSGELFRMIHNRLGGASHTSILEAYANFGVLGSLIYSVIIGIALSIFSKYIIQKDNKILHYSFYVIFLSYLIPAATNGSIIGVLTQFIALFTVVKLIIVGTRILGNR